jgi:hypothetical protein
VHGRAAAARALPVPLDQPSCLWRFAQSKRKCAKKMLSYGSESTYPIPERAPYTSSTLINFKV